MSVNYVRDVLGQCWACDTGTSGLDHVRIGNLLDSRWQKSSLPSFSLRAWPDAHPSCGRTKRVAGKFLPPSDSFLIIAYSYLYLLKFFVLKAYVHRIVNHIPTYIFRSWLSPFTPNSSLHSTHFYNVLRYFKSCAFGHPSRTVFLSNRVATFYYTFYHVVHVFNLKWAVEG